VIAEIEIDRSALRGNVVRLRELAAPARYAAVLKGNAYGHGLVPTAQALEDVVDMFCVYRADEALALRDAGIAAPLLVLGPVESAELDGVHAAGAAITLWSEGTFLRDLSRVASRRGAPFPVHAKIDTGVTRLGLTAERAASVLSTYLETSELALRGAYTHLAAAEELESAFTLLQLARFETALAPVALRLAERGALRHAAASAAAMLFPRLRLDMIRAGIATYGIWPSPETRVAAEHLIALEPALSWTTELVVVRDVPAGQSVGYGCTFVTERPSRIGVLPIGYAEGIPRALSNAGTALVAGRRVPFVGRVCMNMSFIDVTEVAAARSGSRVTLIGRDGTEQQDANELASAACSIGYELVARLPADVPRRYVDNRAPLPSLR
jgi:alanine racemase